MNIVKHISVITLLTLLAACGGGGGSSTSSGAVTTVSGVASKGIFKKGGTVAVYPVSGGIKGNTPLATGKIIDDNGSYSVNIGSYSGPIVVETYGEYADEATGSTLTIPASAPLRAALSFVTTGQSFSLPVTPLTDLAYRQAGPLTPANIQSANDLISYTMRIDIINTIPVAATADAFANATQSQKNYSLILAAVSQTMATQGTTLEATLATLNSGLATTATATAINSAMAEFINAPPTINKTGVTNINDAPQNIGTVGKKYTLAISGTNIDKVQALTATLTLPTGLILRTDADGIPLSTVFKLTGSNATVKDITFTARYLAASGSSPATIVLTVLAPNKGPEGGLTAGDLITIMFDTASEGTTPAAASVTIGAEFWEGLNGALLAGPVLSLN